MLEYYLKDTCTVTNVYCVYDGATERSSGSPKWYYLKKSDAVEKAKGRGWWGGNANISTIKVIVDSKAPLLVFDISGNKEVLLSPSPKDEKYIKEQALSKLSAEEKAVLGIKEQ